MHATARDLSQQPVASLLDSTPPFLKDQTAPLRKNGSRCGAQIEERRLARVPSYCAICAAGWGFFGTYYFLRNATHTAMLCFPVTVGLLVICVLAIRTRSKRKIYANLNLGLNCAGLFLECLMSGLSSSSTIPFFCCMGVIAAHQSGIRAALIWATVSICLVAILHFAIDASLWPLLRQETPLDNSVAFAGCFLLVAWMAAQAEWFATRYFVELAHHAQHDQLTQLANRYRFRAKLERSHATYLKKGEPVGLLVIDLDSFKEVNDTLGHIAGDTVLIKVAERLAAVVDKPHAVARIGGDEFAVVVNSASGQLLERIGLDIIDTMEEPIQVGDENVFIRASLGSASLPSDTNCIEELLAFADLAAYSAKRSGTSFAFYTPSMTEKITRRRNLIDKFSNALDDGEFTLVYQPQSNVSTEQVVGVEALIRWNHVIKKDGESPEIESISPVEFIPILESTGQINRVGRWVLEQACQQAKTWHGMGIMCRVSVNVSPVQFRSEQFVSDVVDVLRQTGIPARYLDLEITEGVMVDRLEETCSKLDALKNAGVSISVDDFGTGYSSLAYLKHLSIDQLKIDRVFIKDIPELDDGSIAESIVALAKTLGMSVLAEGVETAEQLEFLESIDCDAYQGYFLSKPVSAADCTEFLLKELGSSVSSTSGATA